VGWRVSCAGFDMATAAKTCRRAQLWKYHDVTVYIPVLNRLVITNGFAVFRYVPRRDLAITGTVETPLCTSDRNHVGLTWWEMLMSNHLL